MPGPDDARLSGGVRRRPRRTPSGALTLALGILCLTAADCASPGRPDAPLLLVDLVQEARFSGDLAEAFDRGQDMGRSFVALGAWTIEEGVACDETIGRHRRPTPRLYRRAPALGDARLRVELRLGGDNRSTSAAGLLFRMNDLQTGLAAVVHAGGWVSLEWRSAESNRILATRRAVIEAGRWLQIEIRMSGKRIVGYLDGQAFADIFVEDAAASGGIGIVSDSGPGNSFRGLSVEAGGVPGSVPLDFPETPPILVPLAANAFQGSLEGRDPASFLVQQVNIDDDTRESLIVPPGSEMRFAIRLPDAATLRFEVGSLPPGEWGVAHASRITIGFSDGSGSDRLLMTDLASTGGPSTSWRPVSIDLDPLRGAIGELVFRNDPIGSDPGPYVALANPAVLPRTRREAPPSPSLILVIVDTLRRDHLEAYGYSRETSPFLKSLATESVVFLETLAQSSWTKTSVPSLLTSTYPETHGVRGIDDTLAEGSETLAEVLRRHGYVTLAVQTNPWLRGGSGVEQGFMEYRALSATDRAASVNVASLDSLRRWNGGPFFLYLHYMDTHDPYAPSAPYRVFGTAPVDLYDGAIRELDDHVASLVGAMKSSGLLDSTLVMIASDHGEEFGEHGDRFHGKTLFSEQLAVPWLIHGIRSLEGEGLRIPGAVENLDIAPTALDLLGVPIPRAFQGESRKPEILSGGRTPRVDFRSFAQVGMNDLIPEKDLVSVSTRRWKYIVDRISGWHALYDRLEDPGERADLAGRNTAAVATMKDLIRDFLASRSPGGIRESLDPDSESLKELRSLGYLQ